MLKLHSFVEPIVFFTCACTYTYLTIESQFVYQFVSESLNFTTNQSVEYCEENQTHSLSIESQAIADEVSRWTKIASTLKAVGNSLTVLIITSWSDIIGRRNALLFPVLGALTCSILLTVNIYFRISLILYIVSAIIYGATGGWTTLMNIGTAHLCDTIKKNQRGMRYAVLEIFASLGGGITQIGTGYWVTNHGFLPASVFTVFSATIALLLTLSLKSGVPQTKNMDSIQRDDGQDDGMSSKSDPAYAKEEAAGKESSCSALLDQLKEVFRIYTSSKVKCNICDEKGVQCVHCDEHHGSRVWRLWFYLFTYVVYMAAVDGFDLFMTMFLVSFPLCFSPTLIGARSGIDSAIMVLSPLVIKFFHSLLHFSNQSILLVAISGRMITSVTMFMATTPTLVFVGTAVVVISNLTTPFIRLQISNLVSPFEQGSALALVPCIAKVVDILTPMFILTIYPATLHIHYSFIWIVMGLMFFIAFVPMTIVFIADKCRQSRSNTGELKDEN